MESSFEGVKIDDEDVEVEPMKTKLTNVKASGEVTLKFSRPFKIRSDYLDILIEEKENARVNQ